MISRRGHRSPIPVFLAEATEDTEGKVTLGLRSLAFLLWVWAGTA